MITKNRTKLRKVAKVSLFKILLAVTVLLVVIAFIYYYVIVLPARERAELEFEKEQFASKTSTALNTLIQASELAPYLTGMAEVNCDIPQGTSRGSGILWINDGVYSVLTNGHVVLDANSCTIEVEGKRELSTTYKTADPAHRYAYNKLTDIAILPLIERGKPPSGQGGMHYIPLLERQTIPLANLNYKIYSMRKCDTTIPLGSSMVVVGYPASTIKSITYGTRTSYQVSQTVTTGVISALEDSDDNLPYPNYFTSAKIDSGNSGGVAFSKDETGPCLLGIPTWINIGNFDTQGIIQNIHNILYKQ